MPIIPIKRGGKASVKDRKIESSKGEVKKNVVSRSACLRFCEKELCPKNQKEQRVGAYSLLWSLYSCVL